MSIDSVAAPSRPGNHESDLAAEIATLAPWSQNVRLPDGTQTAPEQPAAQRAAAIWEQFRDVVPASLTGCTALDIGCNAGFHAIKLARRGAHVTAFDSRPHFLRQARWTIAQHELESQIDLYRGHPYDLARWRGHYDVVLFLGQLQELRYPQLALDIVTQLTRRCLVLQIGSRNPAVDRGATWWEPAEAAIAAMINLTGFETVARPGSDCYVCQPRPTRVARPRWAEDEFVAATGSMPPGLRRYAEAETIAPADVPPLSIMTN